MNSTYFSKKITFLNVLLTFFIVVLHAKTPERWGLTLDMNYPFIYWTNIFTQIGVPTFFFISGLLFYRSCSFQVLERKLKSRVHSLLIPYLVWNALFVFLFFILAHVPFFHDKMNMGDVLNSPKEIAYAIINSRYSVLWFVNNLMIFSAFSSVVLLMLKNQKQAISILGCSILVALYSEGGDESVYKWFPMYFMGAMIGRFYMDKPDGTYFSVKDIIPRNLQGLLAGTLAFLFILLWVLSGIYTEKVIFWFRLLAPLMVWILIDLSFSDFIQNKFNVRPWMRYMFFIFCTHQFVLNIVQKMVVLTCPPTPLVLNLTFVLSAISVFVFLIYGAVCLSKYKFYKYLSGGR